MRLQEPLNNNLNIIIHDTCLERIQASQERKIDNQKCSLDKRLHAKKRIVQRNFNLKIFTLKR